MIRQMRFAPAEFRVLELVDAQEDLVDEIERCLLFGDDFGQNPWAPNILLRVVERRGRGRYLVRIVADPALTADCS